MEVPSRELSVIPGLLLPGLRHGFSTVEWESMASPDRRRGMAQAMGLSPTEVVLARAAHGADVARVTVGGEVEAVDALITDRAELGLMVLLADCHAVILFDPARRVLGLVHAGWRGCAARVVDATLAVMEREFGSLPPDLVAGIGPGVCGDCYPVREDVASLFDADFLAADGPGQWRLDLRACLASQLAAAGVSPHQVHHHPACTKESSRFFSHRRQPSDPGRFACLVSMS